MMYLVIINKAWLEKFEGLEYKKIFWWGEEKEAVYGVVHGASGPPTIGWHFFSELLPFDEKLWNRYCRLEKKISELWKDFYEGKDDPSVIEALQNKQRKILDKLMGKLGH